MPSTCTFPGCDQPQHITKTGRYGGCYCTTHLRAFERQRWRNISADLGAYYHRDFEADVQAGRISIDTLLAGGRNPRRVRTLQPLPPREVIMERLAEIAPYKEPPRTRVYKSDPDTTRWVDYRCKCAFWRKRIDVWLALNGVYRPPRELDDVTRAAALARLAALAASGERGAA